MVWRQGAWARIASLIGTCRVNGVEPYGYMKTVLEAIAAGHPMARIDEPAPLGLRQTRRKRRRLTANRGPRFQRSLQSSLETSAAGPSSLRVDSFAQQSPLFGKMDWKLITISATSSES
jgi:hypothetical protein